MKVKVKTKIILSSKLLLAASTFLFVTCAFFMLRLLGFADAEPDIISVLFVGGSAYAVLIFVSVRPEFEEERKLVFGAYILRVVLVFVDIYGRNFITLLHSGGDTEGFYYIAMQYYMGLYERHLTYSHFLNLLFHFYGTNRVVAQQINVLFWVAAIYIFLKLMLLLEIKKFYRVFSLIFLCFTPNYLFLSVELMRESIIAFLNILGFYFLVKWMKEANVWNIILAFIVVLPAIVLHTGSVTFWIVFILMLMFFNPQKQKFQISLFTVIIGVSAISCFFLLYMIPNVRNLLLGYIRPSNGGGILAYANQLTEIFRTVRGSSTYLDTIYIDNYAQLLICTFRRMYYFLFSPMPTYWRGISDVAVFLVDSSIYLVSMILLLLSSYKRRDPIIVLFIITVLIYALFFSWGVSNAGTAMRHRTKIVGIAIAAIAYCINSWGQRKNHYNLIRKNDRI